MLASLFSRRTQIGVAARLIRAQEEERALVARELHDDIGQSLALLTMKLATLELGKSGSPSERVQVEDLRLLAEKIGKDVQSLSHGLHSASLELVGLTCAIRQQCAELAKSNEFTVQSKISEVPRNLDKDIAVCLFRVAQESLRNIVKHSNAREVFIGLSADSDKIHLLVSDDGVGFDIASKDSRLGLGLTSMRERLRMLRGGKLSVISARGEGTRIEAVVSLRGNVQSIA